MKCCEICGQVWGNCKHTRADTQGKEGGNGNGDVINVEDEHEGGRKKKRRKKSKAGGSSAAAGDNEEGEAKVNNFLGGESLVDI